MIDSITGKRVEVAISIEYGPFIRVSAYDDAGALEDLLDDKYYVLYWKSTPAELAANGGNEYYFGNGADPEKIQKILDEIVW